MCSSDLGWRVSLMGLDVTRDRFPGADQIFEGLDFSKLTITKNTHVVVASHGNYDEDMLVAALQSEALYVALIASKKRANAILQYLSETNLTGEQIARLKYPAGLDFGAVTPEEIAFSILAEIIQRRRQLPNTDDQSPTSNHLVSTLELPTSQTLATEAIDPVCGMTVEIASAHFMSEYNGKKYYFCAAGCKRSFDKEPGKYVQVESPHT